MYSLSEIKVIKDEYEVEEVNCLEKPVALMLHSFNPIYRNLYLMLEKMNRCYNLEYYADVDYRDMISMKRATVILEKAMNIHIYKSLGEKDIHKFIRENLDKNNPVIVPGNLRKLYYSKFYNKADWIHSFLVYGHDDENDLYHVFDSTQCDKSKKLYKFVVPKGTLEDMHISFNKDIYEEGIYYIESEKVDRKQNCRKIFYDGLSEFTEKRKNQPFVEIDLIEEMLKLEKVKNYDVIRLLEINNYKKVFLNEVVVLAEMFNCKEKTLEGLRKKFSELLDSWRTAESKFVYYLRKKKNEKIYELVEEPLKKEEEILKYISEMLREIRIDDKIESDLKDNIVNNEDGIISRLTYQKYSFNFKNKKTYNNWFEDLSPRVIINHIQSGQRNIEFESDFEITKYDECANFMFGIYLNDDRGNIYLYGNNSMKISNFEHTGVNNSIFENDICDKKYNIKVRIKESKLEFTYTEYGENQKVIKNEFIPYGNICQIGITCKTWGSPYELELLADNIKFKVED